jgi:hypothetical protein
MPGTVVAALAGWACVARHSDMPHHSPTRCSSLTALACTLLRAGSHYWHRTTPPSQFIFSAPQTYRPDLPTQILCACYCRGHHHTHTPLHCSTPRQHTTALHCSTPRQHTTALHCSTPRQHTTALHCSTPRQHTTALQHTPAASKCSSHQAPHTMPHSSAHPAHSHHTRPRHQRPH